MSKNEQDLRDMLARHHADYVNHSTAARGLRADDEDATAEIQLALAASNAMQAIAVLISREPAGV